MIALLPKNTPSLLVAALAVALTGPATAIEDASTGDGAAMDTAATVDDAIAGQNDEASRVDEPIWRRDRLTGDWFGLRAAGEYAGVTFGAEYIAEWSGVLDGGVSQAGSFRNLLTADLTFDTEALIGLPGGTAF
ncbi:MAG: hypothetical protein AAGK09_15020, partial [Planctomycetota bacterium]